MSEAQRLRRLAHRQSRKARFYLAWERGRCPCGQCGPAPEVRAEMARLCGYHAGRAVALRLAALDAEVAP